MSNHSEVFPARFSKLLDNRLLRLGFHTLSPSNRAFENPQIEQRFSAFLSSCGGPEHAHLYALDGSPHLYVGFSNPVVHAYTRSHLHIESGFTYIRGAPLPNDGTRLHEAMELIPVRNVNIYALASIGPDASVESVCYEAFANVIPPASPVKLADRVAAYASRLRRHYDR